ncbi:MAG: CopG family transcriptional regulator [Euryarchaeota archaeon]|nr:CopG family transcriptional regulator [Euryarchaeota archaeon]
MAEKNPLRVTIALDDETGDLFQKLKSETSASQSEIIRRALKFYHEHKDLVEFSGDRRLSTYLEMLPSGEHVILDVDHWLLFLKVLEASPERQQFWDGNKAVARSHAEQLSGKMRGPRDLLERLADCNFYKLIRNSDSDYTLLLANDATKRFVKTVVEDFAEAMGFPVEIKEDFGKLRVKVKK